MRPFGCDTRRRTRGSGKTVWLRAPSSADQGQALLCMGPPAPFLTSWKNRGVRLVEICSATPVVPKNSRRSKNILFAYIFELSSTSAAKFRMMRSSKKTGVYKMKAVDASRRLSLCEISPESFWSDLGL
jgi:hypothetical protein